MILSKGNKNLISSHIAETLPFRRIKRLHADLYESRNPPTTAYYIIGMDKPLG